MPIPDPEHFPAGGMTDVGQVREINQDSLGEFHDAARRRRLFVVADGMGGHLGGEVASHMAVEAIAEIFQGGGDDPAQILVRAFETANDRVYKKAQEDMELAGMGTTGVCLLLEPDGRGWIGHVGDSRAYRQRNGELVQLTEDHSVVGALIRMGHITEDEAKVHPQRNEILRAIGTNEQVEVQVTPLELEPGDRYLLCSDGLSGLVPDAEIDEVLARQDPEDAVRTLVQMANLEGGNDNITVQVVQVPGEPVRKKKKERTTEVIVTPDLSRGGPPAWVWGVGVGLLGVLGWLLLRR